MRCVKQQVRRDVMKPMSMVVVLLAVGTAAGADEKPKANARDVVEAYVAAALAGKVADAAALAVEGKSAAKKKRIEELKRLLVVKALEMNRVLVSEKKGEALAVSDTVQLTKANPDGQDRGRLVFALVKSGKKWLVRDIDFRNEEAANEKTRGFEKTNPDAKEIPPRARK
jgi:hypothetical protein